MKFFKRKPRRVRIRCFYCASYGEMQDMLPMMSRTKIRYFHSGRCYDWWIKMKDLVE